MKTILEPQTEAFLAYLNSIKAVPLHEVPVETLRKEFASIQAKTPANAQADVEDRDLPCGPHGSVSVRIVRPPALKGLLPAILYFHGGGWVAGDKYTHGRLICEIAVRTSCALVFVNYSLAPELQHPIQIQESVAVAEYVSEHGTDFDIDTSRIGVMGDDVGGTLACVVALLTKKRGKPKLAFQVLFHPVTDAEFDRYSYERFQKGYYLTRKGMKRFWNLYAPDDKIRRDFTVAPLRADLSDLEGLPRSLIITAENDIVRDEGEIYAGKLIHAKVPVLSVRMIGTIHGFVVLNSLANTLPAQTALTLAEQFVKASW